MNIDNLMGIIGFIGFIVMIVFIVGVHELGHLIAAKIFNVYCSEYAIGMGPCLYRKKNKETDFTIRAIPVGGFCSMAGESENGLEVRTKKEIPLERTLKGVAKWKQIIIYLSGVTMNFITGFIIIVIALMTITMSTLYVENVDLNGPSANIIQPGDKFVAIDGKEIDNSNELYSSPDGVIYTLERDGKHIDVTINSDENGSIGVSLKTQKIPFSFALQSAPEIFKNFALTIIDGIKGLISTPTQVSGVVGIYSFTSEAVREGWSVYLLFMALISINVGIFNLIPLPVMDGGRVLILIIEKLIGRNLNKKLETAIMLICSFLLILLMLWALGLDVYRLINGSL